MIPDSEVGLRGGGLVTIGGALGLLERGLCNGAANRSDANNRKSDGNRGPMNNCEMLRGMTASTSLNAWREGYQQGDFYPCDRRHRVG
jgi:hypothetical protein